MIYLVFILALSLAGVAGVQFFYLMFLQKIGHQDKRRLEELEVKLRKSEQELLLAEHRLESIERRLNEAIERQEGNWPEIIDG
jgi:16S rRNA C1402 (ribose-2'-O) methylase RsmI